MVENRSTIVNLCGAYLSKENDAEQNLAKKFEKFIQDWKIARSKYLAGTFQQSPL